MESPLISVIVPVYNVKTYLPECIESVLSQSLRGFELILVDDGSDDGGGEVCDVYAKKDARIKAIHKQNGGLSDARNKGLAAASGEYVLFLDGDDYYTDICILERLVNFAKEKTSDLVCFNYTRNGRSPEIAFEDEISEDLDKIIRANAYTSSACLKLIKKELLAKNRIAFIKGQVSEDILFSGRLLECADKIVFLNVPYYFYRVREASITKTIRRKNIEGIHSSVQELSHSKSGHVLSYAAFQYATLLINIHLCSPPLDKALLREIYGMKNILNHDEIKQVKLINLVRKLAGIRAASWLVTLYFKLKTGGVR